MTRQYRKNTIIYVKNPNRKNHGVACKSTISSDYREKKKISQSLFTIVLTTSLNPNYCASPFIEKNRVSNCDITKLPLTRGLSFIYHETFRLHGIHCASGMFFCSVTQSVPPETLSDSPRTWACYHLKLQACSHSPLVHFTREVNKVVQSSGDSSWGLASESPRMDFPSS